MLTQWNVLKTTLAALIMGLSAPACAEMTAAEMIKKIDAGERDAIVFLMGISTGIEWSNTEIEDGGKVMYCQPKKLRIAFQQNVTMLRDLLKDRPDLRSIPAGYVVLLSYIATFPCSEK
jgi:hypothetical protein